jgi:hypothetical protein
MGLALELVGFGLGRVLLGMLATAAARAAGQAGLFVRATHSPNGKARPAARPSGRRMSRATFETLSRRLSLSHRVINRVDRLCVPQTKTVRPRSSSSPLPLASGAALAPTSFLQ